MADDTDTSFTPQGPTDAQEQAVNKQLFPDQQPQPAMPPPSTTTPDFTKTPEGKDFQAKIDSTQAQINAEIEAVRRSKDDEDNSLKERDDAVRAYQDQLKAINAAQAKPPQLSNIDAHEHMAARNQIQFTWPTMLALGLAVAGMFGKHHGSSLSSQFFIGNFLNSYAKGAEDQQKEAANNYWKSVEYEYKQNQERLQTYREQLSNAHFDLQTKMQMVKTYADLWKDRNVSRMASQGLLSDLNKQLGNYQKAQERYLSESWKTFNAMTKLAKFPDKESYETYLQQDYAESHNGHFPSSESQWNEEMKKIPYTKWYQERHDIGGRDPNTGKTRGFTTPTPTPGTDNQGTNEETPPSNQDNQKTIDDHANQFLGTYGG